MATWVDPNRMHVPADGHHLGWLIVMFAVGATSGCGVAATTQNARGVQLFQQGQYTVALQEFQKATASDPMNADAYYNLARTYQVLGQAGKNPQLVKQSEMLYNQCLDRNPNHTDCHRALAVLLVDSGRSEQAFNLLKNWSANDPRNADARIELARLYDEFGDRTAAQTQLQQAVQLDQTNGRAWAALAHVRESSGDVQQALANYQRAYSLDPKLPGVAERIAALSTATGTTVPASDLGTRTVNSSTTVPRF